MPGNECLWCSANVLGGAVCAAPVCLKDKADRRRRRLRRLRGRRPNGLATLHLRQNETEGEREGETRCPSIDPGCGKRVGEEGGGMMAKRLGKNISYAGLTADIQFMIT